MNEELLKYALIILRAMVRNENEAVIEVETASDVGDLIRVYRNITIGYGKSKFCCILVIRTPK